MKKILKIMSLIMTVVLLTLTLGSCSAIKFAIMTDPAKAIYLYEQMQFTAGAAYSANIVTDMTIDQTLGKDVRKNEYRFEVSFSDMGEETMKYIERNYETINGISQLQGVFGFSDGKVFISRDDNNMLSTINAEGFIDFMGETSSDDTYFDMSILNCGKSSYIEDDGIYRVSLSEFYGEAEPCLVNVAANMLGINKGLLKFKAYSIEAELDEDYYPISETEVLEVEANFGSEGIMSLKLTMKTNYSDIDEPITVDIPNLTSYRTISDLPSVMIASQKYNDFFMEASGSFRMSSKYLSKDGTTQTRSSVEYGVDYTDDDNGFKYTVDTRLASSMTAVNYVVTYVDGVKRVDYDKAEYEDTYDNVAESVAQYAFVYSYLDMLRFDVSWILDVTVTENADGGRSVKMNADVSNSYIISLFVDEELANKISVESYTYTFNYDADGNLLSCVAKGESSFLSAEYDVETTFTFNT